jgi:FG-GAP-like repeat
MSAADVEREYVVQARTLGSFVSRSQRMQSKSTPWAALALASVFAAVSVPATAQIAFQAQTAFATISFPSAVAVGDFNRDGDPDLAVTSEGNNRVYIYTGNGGGTFSFAISYLVGSQPVAIVAVDLNHDGKLDLAVANRQSGTVSILVGHGDALFNAAVAYPVGALPESISAGSFNPDGYTDLVTANSGDVCGPPLNPCGTISVLRNFGDATFYTGATLYPGVVPTNVATGTFTASGDGDFVVTSAISNEFLVYLGDGGGAFPVVKGPFTTTSASAIAVADFNGGGATDLALSRSNSGDVSLQLGNGDGTFQSGVIYSEGVVSAHPYAVATGDFDGDGYPDLALANYTDNSVAVLRDRTVGNGGFDAPLTFTGGLNNPSSIAVGDFNRDGKPDLVVVNSNGNNLSILLNASVPTDRVFAGHFE